MLGGWNSRGNWRYGICVWDHQAGGWYSERGATPTHYLTLIPISAPEGVQPVPEAVSGPVVLDASPDPAITDWDGDPTGPPLL